MFCVLLAVAAQEEKFTYAADTAFIVLQKPFCLVCLTAKAGEYGCMRLSLPCIKKRPFWRALFSLCKNQGLNVKLRKDWQAVESGCMRQSVLLR